MAFAMDAPEHEPVHYRMQADEETRHANGMRAVKKIDWAELRKKSFIPKSLNSYKYKFYYQTYHDYAKREIPLTGEVIDDMLLRDREWRMPLINRSHIKKIVLLGDALYLPHFMNDHLINCRAGSYLNIYPHSYKVDCTDPMRRSTTIGFVEVINLSRNAVTLNGLMAEEDLMRELAREIMPDIICFNIGIADIKQENLCWNPNGIPSAFIKRFKELVTTFHVYFAEHGAPFLETLTFTFNMLPSYCMDESIVHNILPVEMVTEHTQFWGTTYHNLNREFARNCSNEINRRLHTCEQEMFGKFYCLLINPTPQWAYSGLGVDLVSGLPYPDRHREVISNFLFVLSRIVCQERHCTLGAASTRSMRRIDEQLMGGCKRIYDSLKREQRR